MGGDRVGGEDGEGARDVERRKNTYRIFQNARLVDHGVKVGAFAA
jgi:hypothetical protein